jgi:hypothetical protein
MQVEDLVITLATIQIRKLPQFLPLTIFIRTSSNHGLIGPIANGSRRFVSKWKIPRVEASKLEGSPPNQAPGVPVHLPLPASLAFAHRKA